MSKLWLHATRVVPPSCPVTLQGMPESASISLPAEAAPPAANPYRRRTIATNFLAMSLVSGSILLIGIFTTAYSRRALGPSAIGQVNWNAALLLFMTLL